MPSFDFSVDLGFTEDPAMGTPFHGAPAECVLDTEEPSTDVVLPRIQTTSPTPQVLVQVLVDGPAGQQLTLPLQCASGSPVEH